jgi:hypothetical protein
MTSNPVHNPNAPDWTHRPPSVAGQGIGPLQGATLSEAEFVRLPRPRTRCPLTGLSRTSLVDLLDQGLVKYICLRRKGARRGIRLIVKDSLLSYLRSLAEQAEGSDS